MSDLVAVLNLVGELRNWYWQLRNLRKFNASRRRTIYRRIRACKLKLLELGADRIELHHFCLSLTSYGVVSDDRRERWERWIARLREEGVRVVTVPHGFRSS